MTMPTAATVRARSVIGWALLLVWLALLFSTPVAQARPMITLDPTLARAQTLGKDSHYWIDPTGQASPDDVMRMPESAWRPNQVNLIFPFRASNNAIWIRVQTAPVDEPHRHWYLEIPYANLDRATLFTQGANGQWTQQDAGDTLPVANWSLPHRQPLLQLQPQRDTPVTHLLRVAHGNPTSVPVLVTEERQLLRRERTVSLGLGLYMGVSALALLVAVVSALRWRDLAFGLYALFALLTALSAASLSGITGLLLWPRQAAWNHYSAMVFPLFTLATALAFVATATDLRLRSRRLFMLVTAMAGASIALAAAVPWIPSGLSDEIIGSYAIVALILAIGVPAWAAWQGDRYAPAFLVGMVCLAVPASNFILRMFELAPVELIMRFALLAGAGVQLGVLMMTLLRRGRDRSLTAQRLRGLDRIDPGTGLSTPVVVMERLQRMTARAQRQEHQIAVLLIDLVNLAEMRRLFGRRVDQEMPLRMANRLQQVTREIDTVGRLGDQRFVMLLEGPITLEAIEAQAQRVLAHCLRPLSGRPEGWTPKLRMALGVMPRDARQPNALLDKLAVLLDTVAPGDSRLLFRCQ
ncbi:MAG: 7TM diverse intracellular signaling domain-containing protein [Pseudomonadota bacterium]|nr:7TM diverse intracellular signaling domain-containing protein [Pseudomonadota bacterium]